MERFFPVIIQLVLLGCGEVLLICTSSILDQHMMLASIPGIKTFPDTPPAFMGGGNVVRVLQDQSL